MDKYEYIVNLAEKTAKRVSQNRESWMKFLTSAARIYKYPFKEQLLIYAQNPDATACASIEIWNKQAERERLAKEYIYDPSHSEEQAALFLDAAGTEEWTLEDLRTLAAQSDIDSMKILQRKIEQLHKASQKKNNK